MDTDKFDRLCKENDNSWGAVAPSFPEFNCELESPMVMGMLTGLNRCLQGYDWGI